MTARKDYWLGIGLTALGAIILSPDALLFRLLQADLWTAAFWRLLLMGSALSAFLLITRRRRLLADIRALGALALPAALCMTICNLGFVYALSHTSVAVTLALIATAPAFAALFSLMLGERPPLRTWMACAAIAAGIWIIFDASIEQDAWRGAAAAGLVAVAVAAYFTIGRARKSVDMTPALAISGLISASIAACMATSIAPPDGDLPILCLMGLVVMPVSLTLITLGPRRLPAAEVSLLMLLETALGPLWVWLALNETPSRAALIGGCVIVGALTLHGLAAWKAERRRSQSAADPLV